MNSPHLSETPKQHTGLPPETSSLARFPQWHERASQRARQIIKLLLPKRVVEEVAKYRRFKRDERPLYLKIRVLETLGLRKRVAPSDLAGARSFLFICFGNIMRSPMCEALMKQELTVSPELQLTVRSAGLNATPENPAHPWSIAVAPHFGISLEQHRARLLTTEMIDQADVIFAMDYQNEVEFLSRYPEAKDKLFMLSDFAGPDYRLVEIRDPYYGDDGETKRCYQILQRCIQNLVSTLASPMPSTPV